MDHDWNWCPLTAHSIAKAIHLALEGNLCPRNLWVRSFYFLEPCPIARMTIWEFLEQINAGRWSDGDRMWQNVTTNSLDPISLPWFSLEVSRPQLSDLKSQKDYWYSNWVLCFLLNEDAGWATQKSKPPRREETTDQITGEDGSFSRPGPSHKTHHFCMCLQTLTRAAEHIYIFTPPLFPHQPLLECTSHFL